MPQGYQITSPLNEGFYGGIGDVTYGPDQRVPFTPTHGTGLRVAYWAFNDPVSLGHDSSGWGNHAEPQNIVPARPLQAGGYNSIYLDGTSYLQAPPSDSLVLGGNPFAVSCWIRPVSDGTIIESPGRWGVGIENSKVVAFVTDRFGNTESGILADIEFNENQNLVVLFDRNTSTVGCYLDGNQHGSFEIEEIRKLDSGVVTEIGRGTYGFIEAYIDNLIIELGSPDRYEIELNHYLGGLSKNYFETVHNSGPILFTAYESVDDQLVVRDLSMDRYDIDYTNFTEGGFTLNNNILWDGSADGVHSLHSGYLSLAPRLLAGFDDDIPLEDGEVYEPPPDPPEQTGFIPSFEFIINGALTAEGVLLEVAMEGDDAFVVRINNGDLTFEELSSGAVADSFAAMVGDWVHGVVNMYDDRTEVYIDSELVTTLTPSGRSGFENLSLLGDGASPFTGLAGPIIMYEEPLNPFNINEHYGIAYTGDFTFRFVDIAFIDVDRNDDFRAMQYNWTVLPA